MIKSRHPQSALWLCFSLDRWSKRFNVQPLLNRYQVTGGSVEEIGNEVNRILGSHHRHMQYATSGFTGQHMRLQFDVEGRSCDQRELSRQRKASQVLESMASLGRVERA
jgi:hypothetical protein